MTKILFGIIEEKQIWQWQPLKFISLKQTAKKSTEKLSKSFKKVEALLALKQMQVSESK